MKNITTYQNQKILVLGLAKSGKSAALLLNQLGAIVTVNDSKDLAESPDAQSLLKEGIRVVSGGHPLELLDEDFGLVVKNPGIPYENPMIEKAIAKKIPIITEVELAYQVSEANIVGITGTNGKTTTTTMISLILNQGRKAGQAFEAGNIGIPASQVAQMATKNDDIVMELSSFQLLGTKQFCPHIAVITNLYTAHLDYHGTRENYVAAKMRIAANQTAQDFLVINGDQAELVSLAGQTNAKVICFSRKKELQEGAYEKNGKIFYNGQFVMDSSDILVPGTHNIENALAAIIVAKLKGKHNQDIIEVLKKFSGVPHRTQFVRNLSGRKFYNDSKATNILATESALSGFSTPVILLAGGLDRGNGFEELIPALKHVKALILFGETADKLALAGEAANIPVIEKVADVSVAVPVAYDLSEFGDTILLSPACASWDQYPDFEIRGNKFMEAVEKLK